MSGWLFVVPIIFAVMNAVGFALMGADKSRAEKGAFRIPERTLIAVAFMLGGVGSLAGMFAFRHSCCRSRRSFPSRQPLRRNISCGAHAAESRFPAVFSARS